jgi:hypothetical protein
MGPKLPIIVTLTTFACTGLACVDSHDEATMRAAGRLAERRTLGVPSAETLASATIRGKLSGEAKILREGSKARVAVDIHTAPLGHYQALIGDAIPCTFDPTERAGGALSDDIPAARGTVPIDAPIQSKSAPAVSADRAPTWNPLTIGEIHVRGEEGGSVSASFDLKDVVTNHAAAFRDKTVLIRKAGRAGNEGTIAPADILGCGRFAPASAENDLQG